MQINFAIMLSALIIQTCPETYTLPLYSTGSKELLVANTARPCETRQSAQNHGNNCTMRTQFSSWEYISKKNHPIKCLTGINGWNLEHNLQRRERKQKHIPLPGPKWATDITRKVDAACTILVILIDFLSNDDPATLLTTISIGQPIFMSMKVN